MRIFFRAANTVSVPAGGKATLLTTSQLFPFGTTFERITVRGACVGWLDNDATGHLAIINGSLGYNLQDANGNNIAGPSLAGVFGTANTPVSANAGVNLCQLNDALVIYRDAVNMGGKTPNPIAQIQLVAQVDAANGDGVAAHVLDAFLEGFVDLE